MRQAGLRTLSKSDLISVAERAVQEAHTARVLYARLGLRWWLTLSAATSIAFVSGMLITWLAIR